ncbi:MAG: translocation/assembly module TamB, partial [Elusimicrobiota bacterium]|nr:translocation/assembly module TamB [Elusimicrobiota bacterium]
IIEIDDLKITKKNKNTYLEIKKNSKIFFTDTNNAILDFEIYMTNWSLFGIAKGSGNLNLYAQINEDLKTGQVELKNFWVTKLFFRDDLLKFSFRDGEYHDILEISSSDPKNGINGKVLLNDGNVILKQVAYQNETAKSSIIVDGEILKNKNIDMDIKIKKINADIITKIFNIGFFISGISDINANVSNTTFDPIIEIDGNLKDGKFDMLRYKKLFAKVEITKNCIHINKFNIFSENIFKIDASGKIPYPLVDSETDFVNTQKMDLDIKASNTNLGILKALFNDEIILPKGNVDFEMNVGNSIFDPVLNGKIIVSKGSFGLKDVAKNIFSIDSEIIFENNKANIKQLTGRIGKGLFSVFGDIILEDLKFKHFDFYIKIPSKRGLSFELNFLKIPQQNFIKIIPSMPSKIEVKGDLYVNGDIKKYLIKGDLVLNDTNFTYPPLQEDQDYPSKSIIEYSIFEGMQLDINLITGKNVWFENELINLAIEGNANFKGSINNPLVNGDMNFLRGDISYLGIYFKILDGEFFIINNEPFVGLRAETNIQRYDTIFNRKVEDTILLTIEKSSLKDIKFKFESQNYPSTSSRDAMGLAITGGALDDISGEERENYMRREFYRLIDTTLTTPIIKMLVQSTGIVDFVKVNTSIAENSINNRNNQSIANNLSGNVNKNTNLLSGTSLTLGKYLNPNLFVSYAVILEENEYNFESEETYLSLQHEIEAKLKLKKNLYLKGLIDIGSEKSMASDRQVTLEYSFPIESKNFFKDIFKKNKTTENHSKDDEVENKNSKRMGLNDFIK